MSDTDDDDLYAASPTFTPLMTAEFPGLNFGLNAEAAATILRTTKNVIRVRAATPYRTYMVPVDGGGISALEVIATIYSCGYRTAPNEIIVGFYPRLRQSDTLVPIIFGRR